MCNAFVKNPNNQFWVVGVDDFGMINDIPLATVPTIYNPPVLRVTPQISWTLAANSVGALTTQLTSPTPINAVPYLVLISPSGFVYLLTATPNGLLTTTSSSIAVSEPIPTPLDIAMSQFPVTAGVICPSCANANVNVAADFSCWCCACNTFVHPEDTTILITLEE